MKFMGSDPINFLWIYSGQGVFQQKKSGIYGAEWIQLPDHGQRKKEYPYLLGYLHICTMNLRIIREQKWNMKET